MKNFGRALANISATLVLIGMGIPKITGMLGINVYAARRVIDAIMGGASLFTIIALCIGGGSALVLAFSLAKSMIRTFGKSAAITW